MRVPRRILVPTDLSEFSLEALQYADEVSRLFSAEIILIHAVEGRDHHGRQKEKFQLDEAEFEARKALVQLMTRINLVPQNIKIDVCHGNPIDEIMKAVRRLHIDMIVMSTHGRTGLTHVLMGSVAEQTVRLSPVPVLTVKPEGVNEVVELREEDIRTNLHLN